MAHRVPDHQPALPVDQASVLSLPPSSQAKVSPCVPCQLGFLDVYATITLL